MNNNRLINVALNSTVTFSSKSQWSHDDDEREILTAEHDRDFSFHTNNENNPWILLDLNDVYIIHSICIYNRRDYQYRANKIKVEISTDNNQFEIIHSGFVYFSDKIEFNLNNLKKCRYVKISLDDIEALHLRKIEVFVDKNAYKLPSWDDIAISVLSNAPPIHPPIHLLKEYTLDGKIPMVDWYFNDINNSVNPPIITKSAYEKFFSNLDKRIFKYYGDEGNVFFEITDKYSFLGKNVTVWGLERINLDAFSLWAGANNVYVVEYNKPIIEHEKVHVFNTLEFQSENIQSDVAISYSSFEHDGLGRYGDPLNPNGDLIAMQQAHNHLSDDGVLLLGVPLGVDCVVWNAHRIYGKLRLPLLLQNFKLLDVFSIYAPNSISFEKGLNIHKQCVLVLKKINDKYPSDDYLLSKKFDNGRYIDNNLFETINKFIYDYKHAEK